MGVREVMIPLHLWIEAGIDDFSAGRFDRAEKAFRRALSLNPSNSGLHVVLADCLIRLNDKDRYTLLEAEALLRSAIVFSTTTESKDQATIGLALCLLKQGKSDLAFEIVQKMGGSATLHQNLFPVVTWFLERGQNEYANQLLSRVPQGREVDRIRNILLHRQKSCELEAVVFPEYVNFGSRWISPRFGDSHSKEWIAGRVIRVDDQNIYFEVQTKGSPNEVFGLTWTKAELEEAGGSLNEIRIGQFCEIHMIEGSSVIFIDNEENALTKIAQRLLGWEGHTVQDLLPFLEYKYSDVPNLIDRALREGRIRLEGGKFVSQNPDK